MQVHNSTSRYHIIIQGAEKVAARKPRVAAKAEALIRRREQRPCKRRNYIRTEGADPPEMADWKWRNKLN